MDEEPRPMPTKTVLVVDDEPLALKAIGRVLASLGYAVVQATEAAAAMEVIASDQPIDLLISDVNMPTMNGFQLCSKLRQMRPDLRALFMCGYPSDTIENRPPGAILVEKPFTQDELARKVLAALATASSPVTSAAEDVAHER
jgi:CheY-like chemotaxis protein